MFRNRACVYERTHAHGSSEAHGLVFVLLLGINLLHGWWRSFFLLEFRTEFHMLRNNAHTRMCFSVGSIPPVLFKPAYNPHAPALVSEMVAAFREFGPGFYVKEAHFLFQP